MFIGQFKWQTFTGGASETICRMQLKEYFQDEVRAETLSEIQKEFWTFFHRNGVGYSNWHIHKFVSGQITDATTGNTWSCDSYGKKTGGKLTMALPTYDKSKRKKSFTQLPKGVYVIQIKDAKEEPNKSGNGSHLTVCFDIAEGEYKGYFQTMMENSTSEDKKWPYDARYYITVPADGCQTYVWDNWNTFFADLEDSNNGFVFGGDPKQLKGKLIGGKFHIEQTEYNGKIYDHTRLKWTCVAEDVRNGKAGKLPNDKLIESAPKTDSEGFMTIPEGTDEEVPW